MRNYIATLLFTSTIQLWRPDINGTLNDSFQCQFVAETQDELDFITERFRQDFDSPGFQQAVIVNSFTSNIFLEMNKANVMQILQILFSFQSFKGESTVVEAINDPHADQPFDDYLITTPIAEILVFDSPRKTWSHNE
jgi:hypothetical protein